MNKYKYRPKKNEINYNFIQDIEKDKSLLDFSRLNEKTRLFTGENCNYKCFFCYYKDNLNNKKTFNEIKEDIDLLDPYFKLFELSGGESSIHSNWFDILKYLKEKNKKISTLSNGGLFYNYDFISKSKDYGLEEILFSIHGTQKTHDKIVKHDGAYNKIMKGIQHCTKLGIDIRINTVVCPDNVKELRELIRLVNCNSTQWNILPLNYWDDASNLESFNEEEFLELLNKELEIVKQKIIQELNIRYIPYCCLDERFHPNIKNLIHHLTDYKDWNNVSMNINNFKNNPDLSLDNRLKIMREDRLDSFFKNKNCLSCKFNPLCDGYKL